MNVPDTTAKPSLNELLKQQILVFDGAMGTSIQTYEPTSQDFEGHEGCNDYLCFTRPEWIQAIHASYIEAGCDCIETNTFGSNRIKLEEYGIEDRLVELNTKAVQLAQAAIDEANDGSKPRYIVGSMGPSGYLPSSSDPSLSNISVDYLQEVYYEQSKVLIEAGVDGLLIETGQDILEMKHAAVGAKRAIEESGKDILLMAQPTLDLTGRMLLGTDVAAIVPLFRDLGVDTLGFNCSTGPDEMRESVRYLSQYCPLPISIIPNAGLPENVDGCAHYLLEPVPFTKRLLEFVDDFGINIVGGCCGTTPEHIRHVAEAVRGKTPKVRDPQPYAMVTSSIQAVDLAMDNRPIVVGERLNSQGSRKFKEILMADDYETMVQMGQQQIDQGAYLLDVCVALNEREDEKEQMATLVRQLSYSVSAPLVIDSTEYDVIEEALKLVPGRAMVNSIHLEGDGERVHKIVPNLKKYGGAAVAMLIDQVGMAKTAEHKKQAAQRIYDVVVGEYGMRPDTLVFDALTFTLATGEEEFKNSAKDTFEAIAWIKENLPGTFTILGVSNASFGLKPSARKVLNSVYLYHAVQAGLDLAIINARDVIPYPAISEEERKLADALVLNQHDNALAEFITYYEENAGTSVKQEDDDVERTVEEQIHWQILNRKKEKISVALESALETYTPVQILNEILLPAMKEVGDKMATGELILPFVLQSAEVMKASVAYLEQYLDKDDSVSKGKVVIATVYGDVHDIGKNLVKTIFSNNGYEVFDLGKQVPLNTILEKAKEVNADAIGLSALLVTTSKQMAYCIDECNKHALTYPILLGGAAINRDFTLRIATPEGEIPYPGGVFYTKDAFEGLQVMNRLQDPNERDTLMQEYRDQVEARKGKQEQYAQIKAQNVKTFEGPTVEAATVIPTPPFWGMKAIAPSEINLDEVFDLMDFQSLYRLSWGLKNKSKDEFEHIVQTEFIPLQKELLQYCKDEGVLQPFVLYGYVPCYREGQSLIMLADDLKTERGRFEFPRQPDRDQLCLSDYFRDKPQSKDDPIDVLPLQLVTMGSRVSEVCETLDKANEYSRSYYLHGLATQMAEGLAEWNHRQIRTELKMDTGQGKRYSFGYPACPSLEDQGLQFEMMNVAAHCDIRLTDAFQIIPEQSTSAFVVHHPKAKYYSV